MGAPTAPAGGRSRSWTSSRSIRTSSAPRSRRARSIRWARRSASPTTTSSSASSGRAFDGTAQPGSKLPIAYTEFGVQTTIPESAQGPYTNLQSPLGQDAVDEKTQADYYRQALELASCQPTVIAVFFFHLFDEPDLNRWQSGPYYADGKPKVEPRGDPERRGEGTQGKARQLSVRFRA